MFGLSFLSPWFLLGLAAAAGPLLLHLFAREHAPLTVLPTMRFVPRATVEQTRRRRLQDFWLLLLRVAAIVLLVLAFARPFFARPAAAVEASLAIVAVDTSFSMAGAARERAWRQLARQAIDDLPVGMPAALMTFDQEARLVVAPTAGHREVAAAVDRLSAGFGTTSFGAALRGALDVARGRPARLIIVSDGQRAGLDAEALPLVPHGFDVSLRTLPAPAENLAVETIDRAEDRVAVRVRGYGTAPRRARLQWMLNDARVAEEIVEVPAGGAVEVPLARRLPSQGVVTVTVDDETGYAADNVRTLVLDPPGPVPVLIVTSVDGPSDADLYVRAALEATGSAHRPFVVTSMAASDPGLGDRAMLASQRVILVVGTRGLDRSARGAIVETVRAGQGLLLAAGPAVEPGVVRELLGGASELGDGALLDGGPQGLVATDPRHPVLSALGETAGNLGQVRVERAWAVRELAGSTTLLRYAAGRPALIEARHGRGRVLLLTTDLGRRWNTWPLHPTFVPVLAQAVRHLSGDGPFRRDWLVDASAGPALARPGVVTLSGGQERVAVNVDPRESAIETVDAGAFVAGLERFPAPTDTGRVEREAEQGQAWWRISLLALLGVLAIEGVMAARPPTARAEAVGDTGGGRES